MMKALGDQGLGRVLGGAVIAALVLVAGARSTQAGFCDNPIPCDQTHPGCFKPRTPPPATCEPPGQSNSCPNCRRSPCYVGSGSFTTSSTDLELITVGPEIKISRAYDSSQVVDGIMGIGWTVSLGARLSYATYLYAAPSTFLRQAVVMMPTGAIYAYTENSDGVTYTPPAGRFDVLVKNPDGTWDLTLQHTETTYHFSAQGDLLAIADGFNNLQTWTYDGNDRVTQITDALTGRYVNIFYGGDGRIATIQDNANRQVQYSYNGDGTLHAVTDAAGRVTTYGYTAGRFAPLLTQITDNWGRSVMTITYDSADRTTSYTEDGETYTYTYSYGGVSNQTAKNYGLNTSGSPWIYTTNSADLVTTEVPPSGSGGATKTTTFDGNGSIQLATDEVGVKTYYTYDVSGNVSSITRDYQGPNAVRFDYTYDSNFPDKVTSITPRNPSTNQVDPTWQAWQYDYYQATDPAPGALHHVYRVENDGTTLDTLVTYTYDSHGRILSQTGATGGEADYSYDTPCGVGNLCSVTAPANNDAGTRPVTGYTYDAVGRVTAVTDPLGNVTSYTYDNLGRRLTTTLPKPDPASSLNFTTSYSYDNFDSTAGLTFTNVTDPNGIVTRQGYNQYGQLVSSVDGLGNKTTYAYSHGLLSSVTDANNNVTSYAYDALRRLSATTLPEGNSESYAYYADGLLHTKLDRKSQTITYAYDHFKRLVQKSYPNSTSIQYTYSGQLLSQVYDTNASPSETHTFQYDPSYRVATNVQGSRGTLTYIYDPVDTVAGYTVQGGPTTSYTYYPDRTVNTIAWTPVAGTFKYAYTLNGQYKAITFPNGQTRNYSYDNQGRLTQLATLHPTTGNVATFGYGYDLNNVTGQYTMLGQRTSMTATVPSDGMSDSITTYAYDNAYQLTQAAYPNVAPLNGRVDAWTYDGIGNRLTNTTGGSTATYSYVKNGSNPLNDQRLQSDGSNGYTYDANGNTTGQSGSSSFTFGWDFENRMVSITGATVAAYTYDYQGRRSSKTAGSTTSYLYNGFNLIEQLGTNASDFLSGPGIDAPLALSEGGNVYYYDVDGLGSVGALSDAAGNIADSYEYDAWGKTVYQVDGPANPFGYAGREFGEAGSWFLRQRFYGPSIARFLSEDPGRPMLVQALRPGVLGNPRFLPLAYQAFRFAYVYVRNTPISRRDPSGLGAETIGPAPPGSGSAGWVPSNPAYDYPGRTAPLCIQCDWRRMVPGLAGPGDDPFPCVKAALSGAPQAVLDCIAGVVDAVTENCTTFSPPISCPICPPGSLSAN